MDFDVFYIDPQLLPCSPEERDDLSGLPLQCKVEKDGIAYSVYMKNDEWYLQRADYEYVLTDFKLRRVELDAEPFDYTGEIKFYGKPYEVGFVFRASFDSGKLISVRLTNRIGDGFD